jgi:hypothetical protein
MSLKLVCISDLHLGAKDSLLSNFDANKQVVARAGLVAANFAKALRETVAAMSSPDEPVRLVLLGDALDLGLSPLGVVSQNLLNFLNVLFPSECEGDLTPFGGGIVYMPGNHDHHAWRMAQDVEYVGQIKDNPSELMADILQISKILNEPAIDCRLVTALMQRVPALRGSQCLVAYPNWALRDGSGKHAVVLHHGHYLDPTYMALSRLAQWLGLADDPASAKNIERCNGPWIDFLWSDLGSAGRIGESADTLYDTMMDGDASHEFAESLSKKIASFLASSLGIRPDSPLRYNLTPAQCISAAVDFTLGRAAQSQRDGYRDVLSRDMVAGLLWYLANPIAKQFRKAYKELSEEKLLPEEQQLPDEIAFIFGHTHKPFQDQIMAPPYREPSRIYNTGGWVLDEPTLMPCQGAAAVLVDSDLNVASLRLFNDVTNDEIAPVRAEGIGGYGDTINPLLNSAHDAVDAHAGLWSEFSNAARDAILDLAKHRMHKRIREMELQRYLDKAV